MVFRLLRHALACLVQEGFEFIDPRREELRFMETTSRALPRELRRKAELGSRDPVVISKPCDLFLEMIGRQDREAAVADPVARGERLASNRTLVAPDMGLVGVVEHAGHPAVLFVRSGELVGAGAVLGGDIQLLGSELRAMRGSVRAARISGRRLNAEVQAIGIAARVDLCSPKLGYSCASLKLNFAKPVICTPVFPRCPPRVVFPTREQISRGS